MPQKYLYLLIIVFNIYALIAQNETTQWYFSNQAHLDFQSNPPILSQQGSLSTLEGSASISDTNGNLLFYTDGKTVWNKDHLVMPNGDTLTLGSTHSISQAAIIIPFPNDNKKYYIFSIDDYGYLYYAIVNMALDNALGDIIIKKQILLNNVEEKMTAVHHCDGKSIWLSVHGYENNLFYAYKIGNNGIGNPIISQIGTTHSFQNRRGYMVFSPNGEKIALASADYPIIELTSFDNNTGFFSNPFLDTFNVVVGGTYGISFSSNSKLLYTSCIDYNTQTMLSRVFQYNTSVWDSIGILNSKTLIYADTNNLLMAMSLAKDSKIYISVYHSANFMDVIHLPNLIGLGCTYEHGYFNSAGLPINLIQLGVPNFIQSYFCPLGPSYNHIILEKDTILPCGSTYTLNTQGDWVSRLWSTGDTSQSITVSQSGCYSITCVRENGCIKMDTVCITIGLVNTGVSQNGASLMANAVNAGYQWIDCNGNVAIVGAVGQTFTPSVNGNYAVVVTENGCSDTSACYLVSNVVVEEGNVMNSIRVYPNPSEGVFMVSVPNMEGEELEIVICDVSGRKVYEGVLIGSDKEMEVRTGLASGLYVLYLREVGTGARAVKRVAVE